MKVNLLGVNGPAKDKNFEISAGITIGRTKGDVLIGDPKISAVHAKVELNNDGVMYLVDVGSTNGILVNNKKIQKLELKPGTSFKLGLSTFKVTNVEKLNDLDDILMDQNSYSNVSIKSSVTNSDEKIIEENKIKTWQSIILDYLQTNKSKIKQKPKVIVPFFKPISLTFTRGRQLNTQWILGFGPRKIGVESIDLPIYEPLTPGICFELIPSVDGISFKTNHPDVVLLNGVANQAKPIQDGDKVKIFETELELKFL